MKNITSKILEGKKDLCPEVQNEFEDDYAYQSFAVKKQKYDYGFLCYDKDQEFYSVTAINEDSDYLDEFCNSFGIDREDLFDLAVGEYMSDDGHTGSDYAFIIVRIW